MKNYAFSSVKISNFSGLSDQGVLYVVGKVLNLIQNGTPNAYNEIEGSFEGKSTNLQYMQQDATEVSYTVDYETENLNSCLFAPILYITIY